jgi:hypothetical protein
MGGGAAIGLIQVGVNEGRRHNQLRDANALGLVVSPLYDGEHAGFILTAR